MASLIKQIQGHESTWLNLLSLLHKDRLAHGLAFVGRSGIGKKKMAIALAQAGLCSEFDGPCGICQNCIRVASLTSQGLLLVAPESGTLKLEHAQEILSFLSLRSMTAQRFVIIDDATNMNATFGNALLKILEEPPAGTHFIFLTQALSQLLPTLRSRLQAVRFFPLADSILATSETAEWMIRAAEGSFAQLEEWTSPEVAAVKIKAIAALRSLQVGKRDGLDGLNTEIKDRENATLLSRLFQQFFRDAIHLRENIPGLVHADVRVELALWAQHSNEQILTVWRECFRLEQDIAANLDRILCFENFYHRTKKILENPHVLMD
jgi:DNA polymerase-3 subunit delta'